jgi:hypothetical protein
MWSRLAIDPRPGALTIRSTLGYSRRTYSSVPSSHPSAVTIICSGGGFSSDTFCRQSVRSCNLFFVVIITQSCSLSAAGKCDVNIRLNLCIERRRTLRPRGHANGGLTCSNISRNNGARTNYRVVTNRYALQYGRVCTNPHVVPDPHWIRH